VQLNGLAGQLWRNSAVQQPPLPSTASQSPAGRVGHGVQKLSSAQYRPTRQPLRPKYTPRIEVHSVPSR
jgi:hypothetical protein